MNCVNFVQDCEVVLLIGPNGIQIKIINDILF